MVELAISGNACFRMSRLELDRVGPTYSADTVEQLAAAGGALEGAEMTFVLSADALLGLPTWHEPARLLAACTVAVAPRLGFARPERAWLSEHFPGQEERFAFLSGPDLGHSASDIRRRAATGRSIQYLVPAAVAAYIDRNRLYPVEPWTTL